MIALYEQPSGDAALTAPTQIASSMLKTSLTNVDAHTSIILSFPQLFAQAILTCGITISSPDPACIIRCRKGTILATGGPKSGIYRPHILKIQTYDKEGSDRVVKEEFFDYELKKEQGGGWHFQADEVARCIRDGKLESDLWPIQKSLLQLELFDEVCAP